jgi:hypothetical protein
MQSPDWDDGAALHRRGPMLMYTIGVRVEDVYRHYEHAR